MVNKVKKINCIRRAEIILRVLLKKSVSRKVNILRLLCLFLMEKIVLSLRGKSILMRKNLKRHKYDQINFHYFIKNVSYLKKNPTFLNFPAKNVFFYLIQCFSRVARR